MTSVPPIADAVPPTPRASAARKAAAELETVFLAEMLRHAGAGAARESFGGGAGEEAFAGMIATEQARALVARGGIGLTERIYAALLARGVGDA
ncbi:MAG: rod-binding protein [Pseudomonadota bacterium]